VSGGFYRANALGFEEEKMDMMHFPRMGLHHRAPLFLTDDTLFQNNELNIPVVNIRHNIEILLINMGIDISGAQAQKDIDFTLGNIVDAVDVHYLAARQKLLHSYLRYASLVRYRAHRHRDGMVQPMK
jgi:hypothetical protein